MLLSRMVISQPSLRCMLLIMLLKFTLKVFFPDSNCRLTDDDLMHNPGHQTIENFQNNGMYYSFLL